jgi:hypothetical protein
MLWTIVMLAAVLLLGQALWATRALAPAFAKGLDQAQIGLALWRSSAFVLLIGLWPLWVERLARRYAWSAAHRAFAHAQRVRVAMWLIVLELVLVQGVLVRFVQVVAG